MVVGVGKEVAYRPWMVLFAQVEQMLLVLTRLGSAGRAERIADRTLDVGGGGAERLVLLVGECQWKALVPPPSGWRRGAPSRASRYCPGYRHENIAHPQPGARPQTQTNRRVQTARHGCCVPFESRSAQACRDVTEIASHLARAGQTNQRRQGLHTSRDTRQAGWSQSERGVALAQAGSGEKTAPREGASEEYERMYRFAET